jgi:hypothetical protein
MTEGAAQGLPGRPAPRLLQRRADGSLHDAGLNRPVTLAELAEDVKDGRRFRAVRAESGASCTAEVLLEVLRAALPDVARLPDVGGPALDVIDQFSGILGRSRSGSGARPTAGAALPKGNGRGLVGR